MAETMTYNSSLDSQYLSNSFSNLSRSKSTNSLIVRTYKQATQLYLTRRFKESLETLEPIVSPQKPAEQHNGVGGNAALYEAAPVAQTSKSTRTKIWVFYLSLLHAIVELGPEEGKITFGSTQWRQLASKARDGTVWDDIVRHGYGGSEGDVDPDVIVNLATLLLGHMPSQKLNQQRLEAYLAASDAAETEAGRYAGFQDGISTPMSTHSSSPKALATRSKILELYTLHVLPANGEWEYAQQFIEMSDLLDEERKEAFLHALENVKEEREGTAKREKELQEQKKREEEAARREEEAKRGQAEEDAQKEEERRKAAENAVKPKPSASFGSPSPNNQNSRPLKPASAASGIPRDPASPPQSPPRPARGRPASNQVSSNSLLQQFTRTVQLVRRSITMPSSRLLFVLLAFAVLFARRDLRTRLRRQLEGAWDKVRRTVGMGVKVSYI